MQTQETAENRTANWKGKYIEANTWAEAKVLVNELTQQEAKELNNALKVVRVWTGLDMRQDFLQGLLANKEFEKDKKLLKKIGVA